MPMVGIAKPLETKRVLMCTLRTATAPVIITVNYHVYESEAASTMLLTTLAMIVTTPIAIAWARV
jgi:malonate transporter and related proteins